MHCRALLLVALCFALPARAQDGVTISKDKESLEFKIGKELVSKYHVGPGVAKPYFYPVNASGNICVTRGWPMVEGLPKETKDHVHQKSMWFCHGDIIPEGIEIKLKPKGVHGVDFWSENPGAGKIVFISASEPKNGPKAATVVTKNEWRSSEGQKILDETRTIQLRDLGTGRLFVIDIELAASVCSLTFGDTKEGSMGVRVNDEIMAKNGGHFYNADGKVDEKEIWGHPSAWVDYVGQIGGKTAGVAVFDDQSNSAKACWHARGYGLLAANPFGKSGSFPSQKENMELVKLKKGDTLKLRYGVYVHAGDTKEAKVAEAYEAFKKRVD